MNKSIEFLDEMIKQVEAELCGMKYNIKTEYTITPEILSNFKEIKRILKTRNKANETHRI